MKMRNYIAFCMAILSLMTIMAAALAGCGGGKHEDREELDRSRAAALR
jgi:uncharacterized lipoprotein YmbA